MGAIVAAGAGTMQQSHHCGIESASVGKSKNDGRKGSNRTIVGLKVSLLNSVTVSSEGSNRTIVGLKVCGTC